MRPEHRRRVALLVAVTTAVLFAALLDLLGVPGGLLLGGTIAGALVALRTHLELQLPRVISVAVQVTVGLLVGIRLTPEVVANLRALLVPALLTTAVLVLGGIALARLLHRVASLPPWVILATCPGGLETILAIAIERNEGPIEVGLFHLVRVLMVIASFPVLLLLF